MAWSSPSTVATGDDITAALWNEQVRDNFASGATWTSYTPAWTSTGTQPSLGNGTLTGSYVRIGDTVSFQMLLTIGSTTSIGTGTYALSLPFTTGAPLLATALIDNGATTAYPAIGAAASGLSTFGLWVCSTNAAVAYNAPFTFAAGYHIAVSGTYRKA